MELVESLKFNPILAIFWPKILVLVHLAEPNVRKKKRRKLHLIVLL